MIVFARAKKQFRSWMIIYAGLLAAVILSGQPASVESDTRLEGRELPADAPLLRRDI
jgi:hypothetical protein